MHKITYILLITSSIFSLVGITGLSFCSWTDTRAIICLGGSIVSLVAGAVIEHAIS